jgi:hypothetical protein
MRKTAGVTLPSPATVLEPTRDARKSSQTDGVDHSQNPGRDHKAKPRRATKFSDSSPISELFMRCGAALVQVTRKFLHKGGTIGERTRQSK